MGLGEFANRQSGADGSTRRGASAAAGRMFQESRSMALLIGLPSGVMKMAKKMSGKCFAYLVQ